MIYLQNWMDLLDFLLRFFGVCFLISMLLLIVLIAAETKYHRARIAAQKAARKLEQDGLAARRLRKEREARDQHTIDTAKDFDK